jgi:hypothetical protein
MSICFWEIFVFHCVFDGCGVPHLTTTFVFRHVVCATRVCHITRIHLFLIAFDVRPAGGVPPSHMIIFLRVSYGVILLIC